MSNERVNDYIDCWARAVRVPYEYTEIVKELLNKLIDKYSALYESVYLGHDKYDKYVIKPIDGKYSMEDFFLNRLLRNVWHLGNDSAYKGDYTPDDVSVSFNEESIKRQLLKSFIDKPDNFNEFNNIARKKVIMHEFEHALQTRFNCSSLDIRYRETYKKIIENIKEAKNGIYSDEINTYEELRDINYFGEREQYISTGLRYSSIAKDVRTYREVEGFNNLNEIFNETESLEMADAKRQVCRLYNNEHYFEIRNLESSNFLITNYGDLLKILLGEHTTFKCMYLDPSTCFQSLNKTYGDVFKKYFNNDKDVVENIIEQLNLIKKDKGLENHLLLQKVLTECFLKKVKNNIGIIPIEQLKIECNNFKKNLLWGVNEEALKKLEHYDIIMEARDLIKKKEEKNKKI